MDKDGLPTRILGIDPGLNITGYGVLIAIGRRFKLHEAGVIRGGSSRDMGKRVAQIYEGLCEVIDQTQPDALALENIYSHYQRPQTAILMGHARGVICLAAGTRNIPVVGYAATQVKKILTGSGRAPKSQVQQAIQRELGLEQTPDPPDVADALAIAMCHGYLGQGSGPSNVVATATTTRKPRRATTTATATASNSKPRKSKKVAAPKAAAAKATVAKLATEPIRTDEAQRAAKKSRSGPKRKATKNGNGGADNSRPPSTP